MVYELRDCSVELMLCELTNCKAENYMKNIRCQQGSQPETG